MGVWGSGGQEARSRDRTWRRTPTSRGLTRPPGWYERMVPSLSTFWSSRRCSARGSSTPGSRRTAERTIIAPRSPATR
eukprot:7391716-Prymnesium_polylepis.1